MSYIRVEGEQRADEPIRKWTVISDAAKLYGGFEYREGVLSFPTEEQRLLFAEWYKQNSPVGLTVRTQAKAPPPKLTQVALCDEALQQLKELRMWHWRQAMSCRRAAANIRASCIPTKRDTYINRLKDAINIDKQADHHISACQALNNILPGSGEYDCAEADRG